MAVVVVAAAAMAAATAFADNSSSGARVTANGAAVSQADCSIATAIRLVNQNGLNNFSLPKPVAQLLCGPFTGPGSDAMAVAIGVDPTCWGVQNWAVFSLTGSVWKLVLSQPAFLIPPLVAVGSDIRETQPVFRPGDPRCIPSGGTHARLWHWNGSRLIAGAWKQVKPADAPAPGKNRLKYGFFKTPSGNIQCDYGDLGAGGNTEPFVRCGIRSGLKPPPPTRGPGCQVPNRVEMGETGRVSLAGPSACPGEDEGDAGPFAGGQPGGPPVSVLGYGKTWRGGDLRCTSAFTGLTCRNKSGHGFFLSRERWRLF